MRTSFGLTVVIRKCKLKHVFVRQGIPEKIALDSKLPFGSSEFARSMKELDTKLSQSTPYYQQMNVEAERSVERVKNILKKEIDE